MRLWHEDLISKLPRQQLLGQWRECIALLGNGWGKKHSTVDYVFDYPEDLLVAFTIRVSNEMFLRGYKPNIKLIINQLNKRHDIRDSERLYKSGEIFSFRGKIYPEHDKQYYQECIENLKKKGIELDV